MGTGFGKNVYDIEGLENSWSFIFSGVKPAPKEIEK